MNHADEFHFIMKYGNKKKFTLIYSIFEYWDMLKKDNALICNY